MKSFYSVLIIMIISCSANASVFIKRAVDFERENYENDEDSNQNAKNQEARITTPGRVVTFKPSVLIKQKVTSKTEKGSDEELKIDKFEFEREDWE